MSRLWVDKIFPQLDELIHIHMNFYRQLQELQNKRQDRLVEEIGWTLKEQVWNLLDICKAIHLLNIATDRYKVLYMGIDIINLLT